MTEVMVAIDDEFVEISTSHSFAFLSYPFHIGISLTVGRWLTKMFWSTYMCKEN